MIRYIIYLWNDFMFVLNFKKLIKNVNLYLKFLILIIMFGLWEL